LPILIQIYQSIILSTISETLPSQSRKSGLIFIHHIVLQTTN